MFVTRLVSQPNTCPCFASANDASAAHSLTAAFVVDWLVSHFEHAG